MRVLRRNLRAVATTWLIFQVAWLTALVPRDCCRAHRPAEAIGHQSHGGHAEHTGHHAAGTMHERRS